MKSRAAILRTIPGSFEVVDVEVDDPKENEVLVRYVASGLCGSDLHLLTGSAPSRVPFAGGHEGAGVVEKVGPGVTRLAVGDHVVAAFVPSCGHCRYCASGRSNLCQLGAYIQSGPMLDGTYRMHLDGEGLHQFLMLSTFSQYACVATSSLVKIPKDVPLEVMCLLGCGVGTGFGSATNVADVRPGDNVLVLGAGGVGMNAVQGAAISGAATVIVVDPVEFKRESALQFGATHTYATLAEAADFVRSITDGQGADSAILTMGEPTNDDVAAAFWAVSKGGTIVVTGMGSIHEAPGIPINLLLLSSFQKSIRGTVYGACNPQVDVLRQIDLYRSGKLKLDELITRRYALDDIATAVTDLVEGRNIRGVIVHDH